MLIYAISVGNNVTDPTLLKQLPHAIDNVNKNVKELGIEGVKVSTTVSLGILKGSEYVAKELLASLSQKSARSLFVSMGNRDVPVGFCMFKVFRGNFVLIHHPGRDFIYQSFDDGQMMDYG